MQRSISVQEIFRGDEATESVHNGRGLVVDISVTDSVMIVVLGSELVCLEEAMVVASCKLDVAMSFPSISAVDRKFVVLIDFVVALLVAVVYSVDITRVDVAVCVVDVVDVIGCTFAILEFDVSSTSVSFVDVELVVVVVCSVDRLEIVSLGLDAVTAFVLSVCIMCDVAVCSADISIVSLLLVDESVELYSACNLLCTVLLSACIGVILCVVRCVGNTDVVFED